MQFWLIPIMEEKLARAYSKLEELLEVHKDHPMTTNIQFIQNNKRSRHDTIKVEIEKRIKQDFATKFGQVLSINDIDRMMSTITSPSSSDMDMMAAEEALDSMNAFYEVFLLAFYSISSVEQRTDCF